MAKNSQDKSLRDGSWTSSQWYSNERVDAAPREWAPADGVPYTHLAYITKEEIELLKRAAKKRGTELVLHSGPEGVSFFAPKSTKIENLEGSEETAKDVPVKWKSSPDHPTAYLVYVTDAQAEFLKEMDIHGSGVDEHDHYGPDNVPSYQGDGGGGEGGGGSEGGAGDAGMGSDFGSTGNFGNTGYESGVDYGGGSSFGMTGNFGFGSGILGSDANADAAVADAEAQAAQDAAFAAAAVNQDAAITAGAQAAQDAANAAADAQAAADFQASMDAANATTSSGLTAAQAAAYGANEMSATDMDAVGAALAAGASPMSATDIDTATDAIANALSQNSDLAQMGQAEIDAIAQSLAESGVGKGFSFSNLTLSNVLSALAIAAGKASPIGAIAGLMGIAAKGFGDKGLAQASQVVGLIGSIASGNVAGALASIGSLTNSPGLATTGALAGLANAISTGNVPGALAAAGAITGISGLGNVSQAISGMNAAQQGNVLGAASGLLGATGLGNVTIGNLASGNFGTTTGSSSGVTTADNSSVGGDSGVSGNIGVDTTTAGATTGATTGTSTGTTTGGTTTPSRSNTDAALLASLLGLAGRTSTQPSTQVIEQETAVPKTGPVPYEQMAKFKGPLDEFLKMVEKTSYLPERTAVRPKRVEPPQPPIQIDQPITPVPDMANYFNYGQETDIDRVLAGVDTPYQFKAGGMATPMMAQGGGLDIIHHSGKPRLDFRKGAAVSGPGDGQSDDIPAMLADGEFVFPADVVAALGNGSTKAGSDKLYKMMHEIRAYHRSAKPKDLPPPAKKSPLDYLKGQRKGRRS